MDYKKIYNNIIKFRKQNKIKENIYTEVHHIKPRSLGGSDDYTNLVTLTSKEHFICHLLLCKIHKNSKYKFEKMFYALNLMKGKTKNGYTRYSNSRLYENIKNEIWIIKTKQTIKKNIKIINEICDWIDLYGTIPKQKNCNINEKKLGVKLNQLKNYKRLNNNFHIEYQETANKRNYKNLFEKITKKDKHIKIINEICDWIDKYNTTPKEHSINKQEHLLGVYLHYFKDNKTNTYNKLIKKRGYVDLFNKYSFEDRGIKKINEICDWMDEHKRKPKYSSENKIEKSLANKLSLLKQSKKKNENFYESFINTIKDRKYPNLFNFKDEQ